MSDVASDAADTGAAASVLDVDDAVVHHAAGCIDRSVVFSFLGRDFYNALSERDVAAFKLQLIKYLVGFVLGIPVFVYSDYLQVMTTTLSHVSRASYICVFVPLIMQGCRLAS